MERVPVGRSIAHAYEFLFGRVFQIIGTAWLPALLYAAGYYFWLQNSATWMAPLSHDPNILTRGIAASIGLLALGLICRAVIGISLTQEALGIRNDVQLAHFVVGPREIRLFFAQLRLLLTIAVLDIVLAVVVVLGIGAAVKYGSAISPSPLIGGRSLVVVGAMVAAVLLYIAFVLTVLKLSFLLTAVASVEHHAKIRRAWQLAHRSGWRIFFVLLGTLLPVAVVAGVAGYMLIGSAVADALHATAANSAARGHAILQSYADHAFVMAAIVAVVDIVASALMAGATAAAYRTVTGHEEPELEDDAALVAPLLTPVPTPVTVEEPLPAVPEHGHGGHDSHGHGHEDHNHQDHAAEETHEHDDEDGEDTDTADDNGHADHNRDGRHDDHHGHGDGHHDHGHDDHHAGHKNHDGHGHRAEAA